MEEDIIGKKLHIKAWAEEDRPREKMMQKGRAALTDAELIAILLGSGSTNETAVELAQRILLHVNNDLNKLAQLTLNDLKKFKGIGEAKAVTIAAALELGRRRKDTVSEPLPIIKSSRMAYELMKPELLDLPVEQFWLILLSRSSRLIKKMKISEGGLSGTVVDPRLIFKEAIEALASSIILVHNHPSGNLNPSEADLSLTKKLVAAGRLLDILVNDHLIFTNNGYYSFADEGRL
jgi:DNA repair protein RadC